VVIVASDVSLIVQVASERGRPCSSTAVNCRVSPTSMLTPEGVIWSEFGEGRVPVRLR